MSELADEKAKHVARFCSTRCERKWQDVLRCPHCNTYDFTKTEAHTFVIPRDLMDMAQQYHRRTAQVELENVKKEKKPTMAKEEHDLYWLDIQRRFVRGETPNIVESNTTIKMWVREPRRVKVPSCVTCSATMLPRNPHAPHLQDRVFLCQHYSWQRG